jgi:hypothetical protein
MADDKTLTGGPVPLRKPEETDLEYLRRKEKAWIKEHSKLQDQIADMRAKLERVRQCLI